MRVGIEKKRTAYLPEVYAYKKYFEAKGWIVDLFENENEIGDCDVYIYFPGLRTNYNKRSKKRVEIHDYASLSTPPYSFIKNYAKKFLNKIPAGYIYLNESVKEGYCFDNNVPYIYRDMGVDLSIFQKKSVKYEYDIIYAGSVTNRVGLLPAIKKLSEMGLSILVVGDLKKDEYKYLKKIRSVDAVGRVDRNDLPQMYSKAKCGLNYTPNVYPYNLQTSTKTLEYCAANLGVLSNVNDWILSFEKKRGGKFLYIENIQSKDVFDKYDYVIPDVRDLEWNKLLEEIEFIRYIEDLVLF